MSAEVAALEAEVKEYRLQLETVQSGLQTDPDSEELQNLQQELEEVISLTNTAIAELKPTPAPPPSQQQGKPPPAPEKWSKEKHPAYQAGYRKPDAAGDDAPTDASVTFAVNDGVMARWKSGDRGFYPAKISAITGSSARPVYTVTFRIDGSTDTLAAHDIRPLSSESKKRKADALPGAFSAAGSALAASSTASPAAPYANPGVISAAANINTALATQAKKEPSKVGDGPDRPAKALRKVKANKELEAGKNKWQEFSAKSGKTGRSNKKDSMFRTGDGVNARVGFTGSGQEMRKDQARTRHKYAADAEEGF